MPTDPANVPRLRASYETATPDHPLDHDVLVSVAFGSRTPLADDQRCLRIDLEPLSGLECVEVWRGQGPVRAGTAGLIRYAEDGEHCAGYLSIAEEEFGSLASATEAAYRDLLRFHAGSPYRHVWRMWNYISDINAGSGDEERYRQFCVGRARAFAAEPVGTTTIGYPAASAVGKQSATRSLEICWVASRAPGVMVENPRQTSAYQYPRRYGPAAPSFSRATVTGDGLLLISGTSSIVGHVSVHAGDLAAQLDETLRNIDVLLRRPATERSARSRELNGHSLVKAYLRNPADAPLVERQLRGRLGSSVPLLILAADICRDDLLVEIEVTHQG